ncbi:hypothetical protein KPH14_010923 [Odynerus spinipes]|uniref:Uncharacterized protein n=1 Tax=Odynerus spinipes TaxID=1348599 RepID=A0AAD9RFG2_9HYME|nr:hypothetical protein KPH14_010923 [Odynerus spinipes]
MQSNHHGNGTFVRNRDLIEEWISEPTYSKKVLKVIQKLASLLNVKIVSDEMKLKVKAFCMALGRKWKDCSRSHRYLFKRHHVWLDKEISITSGKTVMQPQLACSRERPRLPFQEASLKTKKRRIEPLLTSHSYEELNYAATVSKKSRTADDKKRTNISHHELVALYLDLGLSDRKYETLRCFVNKLHEDCFPSIKTFRKIKNSFLSFNITITETSAEVDMQNLLNGTSDSILKLIKIEESCNLKLVCKWGFDALVPLKLVDMRNGKQLWINSRSPSTLFCRPIKFMFAQENAQLVRQQEITMKTLISRLSLYKKCELDNDINLIIRYELHFTMIDGSICNILSNTNASAKCYICGSTPKEMNFKGSAKKLSNIDHYRFGLSTLHAWIRT